MARKQGVGDAYSQSTWFRGKYPDNFTSTCSDYATQRGVGQKVITYSYYVPGGVAEEGSEPVKKFLEQLYPRAERIALAYPGIALAYPGCVCHSFALRASDAVTVLPSYFEAFLKDLTSYFSRSSKRKNDFQLIQEAVSAPNHQIPKLVQTRWLSRENVISAIIDNYDALLLYFRSETTVDKVDGARRINE
ncbi:hypothetical protein FHG87_012085, partial [Trinorchestia longiramus]